MVFSLQLFAFLTIVALERPNSANAPYKPVDGHVPRLPYAMTSVLRLRIHCRIPVTVVEDHRVGPNQINTHAAGTSR